MLRRSEYSARKLRSKDWLSSGPSTMIKQWQWWRFQTALTTARQSTSPQQFVQLQLTATSPYRSSFLCLLTSKGPANLDASTASGNTKRFSSSINNNGVPAVGVHNLQRAARRHRRSSSFDGSSATLLSSSVVLSRSLCRCFVVFACLGLILA